MSEAEEDGRVTNSLSEPKRSPRPVPIEGFASVQNLIAGASFTNHHSKLLIFGFFATQSPPRFIVRQPNGKVTSTNVFGGKLLP
jgi:hypothetical protein